MTDIVHLEGVHFLAIRSRREGTLLSFPVLACMYILRTAFIRV